MNVAETHLDKLFIAPQKFLHVSLIFSAAEVFFGGVEVQTVNYVEW